MSGDRSDDTTGDMSGDGRWMTYAELAEHRSISRPSAERLVLRKRWRRQRGNDRTVRILVPWDSLSGDMTDDTAAALSDDTSADMPGDVTDQKALLGEALGVLKGALTEAHKRAEAALALADRLEAQLASAHKRSEGEITTLRDAVGGLRTTLARTEDRAARAEERAARSDALVATLEGDLRAKNVETAEQRAAAEQARIEAQQAQGAARLAEEQAEVLRQAEAERKGRGRLRRAWDGWRGR